MCGIIDMQNSRFNIIHAITATVLVLAIYLCRSPAALWRQFVYGYEHPLTAEMIRLGLVASGVSMGVIAAALFASTLFARRQTELRASGTLASAEPELKPNRLQATRLALCVAPGVIAVAIGLQLLTAKSIEWIWGIHVADQGLVKFFLSPSCTVGLKVHIVLSILLEAPIVEEALFRGVIFRGFARSLPVPSAMAISGFLFAVVHMNAASFFGVWFLGLAFAWIYARTRTILAPILLHGLFNAFNLVLLLFFPELVT